MMNDQPYGEDYSTHSHPSRPLQSTIWCGYRSCLRDPENCDCGAMQYKPAPVNWGMIVAVGFCLAVWGSLAVAAYYYIPAGLTGD